jgi:hypothetical protein
MGDENRGATVLRQHLLVLDAWRDEHGQAFALPVVLTADGRAYFPIGMLCTRILRIDPRPQLDRLREHAVLSQMVCQHRIETPVAPNWCGALNDAVSDSGGEAFSSVRSAKKCGHTCWNISGPW